ncbi:MAG TPA: iron-containing redox enzyme family protein [Acidimicrobiales bacterium]|nr:iron-containing redox enzyme family protein [Acidimicrobiales bacterium]
MPEPRVTHPTLPAPRGPVTERLLEAIVRAPGTALPPLGRGDTDPLVDEDLQLALYTCYELSYRGFAGVDAGWEWDPGLLSLRRSWERPFEEALRRLTGPTDGVDAQQELRRLTGQEQGPSLSAFVESEGTVGQFREMCIHRSAWQLKEADPHTWAIPRLAGPAKVTLTSLQYDEYGAGDPLDMHSALFAETMRQLELDPRYGAYLDLLPAFTLATVNLVTMFGLHRRLRGALVGHLTLFEMTSVGPMSSYSRALARLGYGAEARRFFDVHVAADARHGEIAVDELVGRLLEDEPDLAGEMVFGARAVTLLESRFTDAVLGAWDTGRSSLRAVEGGPSGH